jgi:hypothetical protein
MFFLSISFYTSSCVCDSSFLLTSSSGNTRADELEMFFDGDVGDEDVLSYDTLSEFM